jgi:cardiolipin synthase
MALMFFLIAGLSDGVDGFLAKYFEWRTPLGGFLDPVADKLLMVSSTLALGVEGLVPVWLVAAIVSRDIVIVAGAVAYRICIGRFQAAPTVISKINTGVQIVLVVVVLATRQFQLTPDLPPLYGVVLIMTVASGVDYVIQWGRRARAALKDRSV